MDDPGTKEELIQKLLKKDGSKQQKSQLRRLESPVADKAAKPYPGKNDPQNPENEADFKKAYRKLAEKLATEKAATAPKILLDPKELQAAAEERQKMESARQFQERVYGYAEKIKQKKGLIKEEAIGTELKECTFSPQTVRPVEQPRTLDEFLQDQSRFQQRKQDNIAKISEDGKEKVKEDVSQMPQIDENSAALASKKPRDEPIFERLYSIAKKPIQPPAAESEKKEDPKHKLENGERREFRLYQIAVQKNKEWFEKKAQEEHPRKPKAAPKDPSVDPMIIQGFRKEFLSAAANLGLTESSTATYEQMKSIMTAMWLIDTTKTKAEGEEAEVKEVDEIQTLVKNLWAAIKLSEKDAVPITVLEAYLAAALNIKLVKPESTEEQKEQGEFPPTLTNDQIFKIFKDYQALFIHRKSNKPQKRKQLEPKEFQFKPELCKESVRLAETGREKYAAKPEGSKNETVAKETSSVIRGDLAALADAMATQKRAHQEYPHFLVLRSATTQKTF